MSGCHLHLHNTHTLSPPHLSLSLPPTPPHSPPTSPAAFSFFPPFLISHSLFYFVSSFPSVFPPYLVLPVALLLPFLCADKSRPQNDTNPFIWWARRPPHPARRRSPPRLRVAVRVCRPCLTASFPCPWPCLHLLINAAQCLCPPGSAHDDNMRAAD